MGTFLAPEAAPFLVATIVLLVISLVEGIGLLAGMSASHWLDGLLHDHHGPGLHGPAEGLLGWLHVGRVPILALIVTFLGAFAVVGFAINLVSHALIGFYVPALLGAPVAFIASLPVVRGMGNVLARLMPKDESSAVTLDSLVGRIATIVTGTARLGYPAQAKVTSEQGQVIYLMVEPDSAEHSFGVGEAVLLVRQVSGTRFQGIRNPKPELL